MNDGKWIEVCVIQGDIDAEILKGLLEAHEIPVLLSKEGAGRALGLTMGPLGEVEILVPVSFQDEAASIIEQFKSGEFDQLMDQDV